MQKNFFDGLPLDATVQFIADLAKLNLPPSKEALARLYELEEAGEQVKIRLSRLSGKKVVEEYEKYKASGKWDPKSAEKAKVPYAVRELTQAEFDEYYFQELWIMHLRYVPVFTMLYEKGEEDKAKAYRLFANHG